MEVVVACNKKKLIALNTHGPGPCSDLCSAHITDLFEQVKQKKMGLFKQVKQKKWRLQPHPEIKHYQYSPAQLKEGIQRKFHLPAEQGSDFV